MGRLFWDDSEGQDIPTTVEEHSQLTVEHVETSIAELEEVQQSANEQLEASGYLPQQTRSSEWMLLAASTATAVIPVDRCTTAMLLFGWHSGDASDGSYGIFMSADYLPSDWSVALSG